MNIALPVVEREVSGAVIWRGPSEYDGKPIVVLASGLGSVISKNEKTGPMIQIYIMREDMDPLSANKCNADMSVCANCKHREFKSCYVNLAKGVYQVYRAYKDGKYPVLGVEVARLVMRNNNVRIGTYGDPAAVPVKIWQRLIRGNNVKYTGYTHQWAKAHWSYREFCMASCDTIEEAKRARKMGWKPFLILGKDEPLPPGFFACPASKEEGKRTTCEKCGACRGGRWNGKMATPAIYFHGPSWKRSYYEFGMKLFRQKKKFIGVLRSGQFMLRDGKLCAKSNP